MDIYDATETVVGELRAAGLAADQDTSKLNPPCAWVAPERLTQAYLDGSGDLGLSVYLIAQDLGYSASVSQLQGMLAQALDVLSPDGEIELDHGIETNGATLPAYKIPLIVKAKV